ncbi:MAG TPA: outer membrane lipoprotein chaperone LolA [Vicinamibacteria bacterium]|nr:outer membrane lipoprotein chaperone LolA [Vicinamibacteria bacterium]
MLTALALTGVLALPAGAVPAPPERSAEEVVRRVEERHRTLRDLTADFVQTYRSGLLGRQITEKGTVSLKPPGRMRWEYQAPERKTFVSDGRTFYFYVPADRQVITRPQDDQRGLPAQLLSGRTDVLSQFTAKDDEGAPAGLRRVRLVPKKADAEVEWAAIDVDGDARIRGIVIVDAQGNRSQFRFDNVRENVGIREDVFRFVVPRGVEIVTG